MAASSSPAQDGGVETVEIRAPMGAQSGSDIMDLIQATEATRWVEESYRVALEKARRDRGNTPCRRQVPTQTAKTVLRVAAMVVFLTAVFAFAWF